MRTTHNKCKLTITEDNTMHLVVFGMHNRTFFHPYLANINRVLIPVLDGCAATQGTPQFVMRVPCLSIVLLSLFCSSCTLSDLLRGRSCTLPGAGGVQGPWLHLTSRLLDPGFAFWDQCSFIIADESVDTSNWWDWTWDNQVRRCAAICRPSIPNRTHSVLFGKQNRTFVPCLAAIHRILVTATTCVLLLSFERTMPTIFLTPLPPACIRTTLRVSPSRKKKSKFGPRSEYLPLGKKR
jgi:hypothetical protein